jgi:LPS export ABC transporter protein LptC
MLLLPPTSESRGAARGGLRQRSGRLLLILSAIALLLIFGGRRLLEVPPALLPEPQRLLPLAYDAYASGVTSVLYNAQGRIKYTLDAAEQIHYLDNTTVLESPFMRLYQETGALWNIMASSGKIFADEGGDAIDRLDLQTNVEVYQIDELGGRMSLSTEFLSVFPQAQTMSTDLAVSMVTDTLQQSATGMRADLQQDQLTFLGQVRGRYEVPSSQP